MYILRECVSKDSRHAGKCNYINSDTSLREMLIVVEDVSFGLAQTLKGSVPISSSRVSHFAHQNVSSSFTSRAMNLALSVTISGNQSHSKGAGGSA